jgi:hypothetical protein
MAISMDVFHRKSRDYYAVVRISSFLFRGHHEWPEVWDPCFGNHGAIIIPSLGVIQSLLLTSQALPLLSVALSLCPGYSSLIFFRTLLYIFPSFSLVTQVDLSSAFLCMCNQNSVSDLRHITVNMCKSEQTNLITPSYPFIDIAISLINPFRLLY